MPNRYKVVFIIIQAFWNPNRSRTSLVNAEQDGKRWFVLKIYSPRAKKHIDQYIYIYQLFMRMKTNLSNWKAAFVVQTSSMEYRYSIKSYYAIRIQTSKTLLNPTVLFWLLWPTFFFFFFSHFEIESSWFWLDEIILGGIVSHCDLQDLKIWKSKNSVTENVQIHNLFITNLYRCPRNFLSREKAIIYSMLFSFLIWLS